MEHVACYVAMGIAVIVCYTLVAALIQCDRRRINAEEEIARRDARDNIHKWGYEIRRSSMSATPPAAEGANHE